MIALSSLFVQKAYAADIPSIRPLLPGATPSDPSAVINSVYSSVFTILLLIAGALAVIYLIWAGIQYITSNGSPDKAKAARGAIINAVIGIIILISAYAIIRIGISIGREIGTNESLGGSSQVDDGSGSDGTTDPTKVKVTVQMFDKSGNPIRGKDVQTVAIGENVRDGNYNASWEVDKRDETVAILAKASDYKNCEGNVLFNKSGTLKIRFVKTGESGSCEVTYGDSGEEADRSVTVTVQIFDINANPREVKDTAAQITLDSNSSPRGDFKYGQTFTIENSNSTTHTVLAKVSGFQPCGPETLDMSRSGTLQIRLVKNGAQGTCKITYGDTTGGNGSVSGTFQAYTADGVRITGTPIKLVFEDGTERAYSFNNAFTLNQSGTRTITASASGYKPCTKPVTFIKTGDVLRVALIKNEATSGTCNISYSPAISGPRQQLNIHMVVVDPASNLALENAEIYMKDSEGNQVLKGKTTKRIAGSTTTYEASFKVDKKEDGEGAYDFVITKTGYNPCRKLLDLRDGDYIQTYLNSTSSGSTDCPTAGRYNPLSPPSGVIVTDLSPGFYRYCESFKRIGGSYTNATCAEAMKTSDINPNRFLLTPSRFLDYCSTNEKADVEACAHFKNDLDGSVNVAPVEEPRTANGRSPS